MVETTTIMVPVALRDELRRLETYEKEPLWKIIKRLLPTEEMPKEEE